MGQRRPRFLNDDDLHPPLFQGVRRRETHSLCKRCLLLPVHAHLRRFGQLYPVGLWAGDSSIARSC